MVTSTEFAIIKTRFHPIAFPGESTIDARKVFTYAVPPLLAYLIVLSILTSRWRFANDALAITFAVLLTIAAICFCIHLFMQTRRRGGTLFWQRYLLICTTLCLIAGWTVGSLLYHEYYHKIYSYEYKATYYFDVDPLMSGKRLPDAGTITFKEGTYMARGDYGCTTEMRSGDVYCAAPILPDGKVDNVPFNTSIDAWAVGMNCCDCPKKEFRCGEYTDPAAHSGLRLIYDSERPFYSKAVKMWKARRDQRVDDPIFYHWVENPNKMLDEMKYMSARYFGYSNVILFTLLIVAAIVADLLYVHFSFEGKSVHDLYDPSRIKQEKEGIVNFDTTYQTI